MKYEEVEIGREVLFITEERRSYRGIITDIFSKDIPYPIEITLSPKFVIWGLNPVVCHCEDLILIKK